MKHAEAQLADVKIGKLSLLVGAIAAKLAAHEAVPRPLVKGLELPLDVASDFLEREREREGVGGGEQVV